MRWCHGKSVAVDYGNSTPVEPFERRANHVIGGADRARKVSYIRSGLAPGVIGIEALGPGAGKTAVRLPEKSLSGGIEPDIMDGGHSPRSSSLIRFCECALPVPQTHDVALTDSGLARTAQSKLARESSTVAGGKDKNFCSRCIRFNFDNALPALSFYRDGSSGKTAMRSPRTEPSQSSLAT
jgi:hypothetical protein